MTKNTLSSRNSDVAEYLAQTSLTDDRPVNTERSRKSPGESARMAQELASETSWADRYIPNTPSETAMTPSVASIADHNEGLHTDGSYVTPNEAPPTYELATSTTSTHADTPAYVTIAPPATHEQSQPSQLRSTTSPFGRNYERHETYSSISGTFTLHDSLDLSTTSGSINIKLDVRPGSNPAILKLKSNSGSIMVNDKQCEIALSGQARNQASCSRSRPDAQSQPSNPLKWFSAWRGSTQSIEPPIPFSDDPRKQPGQHLQASQQTVINDTEEEYVFRHILATIETSSGSINAQLLLASKSETRVTSNSGSIHLRMVTAGYGPRDLSKLEQEDSRLTANLADLSSILQTQIKSGSQNVSITTGAADRSSGAIVSACKANFHTLGSGSLNIHYPREWSGLVHASRGGHGSVNVRGEGLVYDKRGNGETWAWRGVDEPDIDRAVELRGDGSGSVSFTC